MFAHRPIDSTGDRFHPDSQAEIRFLEYRRAVIEAWPDSARKRASIEGIGLRLTALRRKAG